MASVLYLDSDGSRAIQQQDRTELGFLLRRPHDNFVDYDTCCGVEHPAARSWIVWEREGARARVAHGALHLCSEAYEDWHLPYFDGYAQARSIPPSSFRHPHVLLSARFIHTMDHRLYDNCHDR